MTTTTNTRETTEATAIAEPSEAFAVIALTTVAAARALTGTLLTFCAPHYSTSPQGIVDECMVASSNTAPGVIFLDECTRFSNEAVQAIVRTLATCARTGASSPVAILLDVSVPVAGVDLGTVEEISGAELDAFTKRRDDLVFALRCAANGSREGLLSFGASPA